MLLLLISMILVWAGCETNTCNCPISEVDLQQLNEDFNELIQLYDNETNMNTITDVLGVYELEIGALFTSYRKTYTVIKTAEEAYLETKLDSSTIRKKRTIYYEIARNRYTLDTIQWEQISRAIDQSCFWTSNVHFDTNEIDSTDYLAYTLRGFSTSENPCTQNKRHMIIRRSPYDDAIRDLHMVLTAIEPTSDLDSRIRASHDQ